MEAIDRIAPKDNKAYIDRQDKELRKKKRKEEVVK